MFRPETEDMLPRAAPKPSAPMEGAVTTTVPEVSILLGQQEVPKTDVPSQQKTTPSYATWKRQVIPRVTFPPVGAEVTGYIGNSNAPSSCSSSNGEYVTTRSNVYPMRTVISPPVGNAPITTAETKQYRRSLENASVPMYTATMQENAFTVANTNFNQLPQPRRSVDTISSHMSPKRQCPFTDDVLTICAGTQTEASMSPTQKSLSQTLSIFATKEDFENLFAHLQAMRAEQQRLTRVCELLLKQPQLEQLNGIRKPALRDMGTQYENFTNNANNYNMNEEQETGEPCQAQTPQNNFYNKRKDTQIQSPHCGTPVAQSTTYRPNTPRQLRPILAAQPLQENMVNVLPKPATEKSMVMNELALKYLPNEKLSEMLQELHLPSQSAEMVAALQRNKENSGQSPNDFSNASYKYLKKYRLLSEESGQSQQPGINANMQHAKSPMMQQQHSPYKRTLSAPNINDEQILDLEHIRRQPKFL